MGRHPYSTEAQNAREAGCGVWGVGSTVSKAVAVDALCVSFYLSACLSSTVYLSRFARPRRGDEIR